MINHASQKLCGIKEAPKQAYWRIAPLKNLDGLPQEGQLHPQKKG
jgi:hypothetical protein